MPSYREQKVLPYSPQQLFELVLDIEAYPQFLPWCVSAHISKREADALMAELTVGYQFFKDSFRSRVLFIADEWIKVQYLGGPLKDLETEWRFRPHVEGCDLLFFIDFQFKESIFNQIVRFIFFDIAHQMVAAFEQRAHKLYGAVRTATAG